ncbi:MAG: PEP-CTERM sorting domain-containing protein, partial [Opitutales bacterium]|nr:PEP-CTERM sorting domain-containing protein [Opitutales bacterium]
TFDTGTNLLTSIYVCDSSGASFDKQSISQVRLGLRKDTTDGTDRLCLLGYYHEGNELTDVNNGEYLANVYFLGNSKEATRNFVFSIPEPSAFGALAGIGALALVAVRRRRK